MLPFTLNQLRILKAVAAEKNLTKAADLLHLSQPSLSKQIKILEKNLDISLINRENNKISFTENGKVFLQYSERILAWQFNCWGKSNDWHLFTSKSSCFICPKLSSN
jgi:predicted transcriptional regulator